MKQHLLIRTSPLGSKFVGTCVNCGKPDLTDEDFQNEECDNITGTTPEEDIVYILSRGD